MHTAFEVVSLVLCAIAIAALFPKWVKSLKAQIAEYDADWVEVQAENALADAMLAVEVCDGVTV